MRSLLEFLAFPIGALFAIGAVLLILFIVTGGHGWLF